MKAPEPILFVIDHFRNPFAGTEGQLYQLVKNLDRERFTPHLLVLTDSDYLRTGQFPCDYTVLGSQRLASPLTWLRLAQLARGFRRQGYLLAHVFFNDSSLICPPIFSLFGIRTLISRRDMGYWYTPGLLRALRVTGRFVTGVLTNSEAVAEITHRKEGIPRERITVIYNGVVDRSAEKQAEIPELVALKQGGTVIAMLVANIRPIKRIEDAIEATARLVDHEKPLHLVVVGGGDFGPLQALASENGVSDRVHFLGARSDVPGCLAHADIGLLCSESEGFSNSIVEYMQQEIPVVCTDTGGNPEAITHGETGFLYPVGDVPALAETMELLVSDEEKRLSVGGRAREDARSRFSVNQCVNRHQAFYGSISAQGSN